MITRRDDSEFDFSLVEEDSGRFPMAKKALEEHRMLTAEEHVALYRAIQANIQSCSYEDAYLQMCIEQKENEEPLPEPKDYGFSKELPAYLTQYVRPQDMDTVDDLKMKQSAIWSDLNRDLFEINSLFNDAERELLDGFYEPYKQSMSSARQVELENNEVRNAPISDEVKSTVRRPIQTKLPDGYTNVYRNFDDWSFDEKDTDDFEL